MEKRYVIAILISLFLIADISFSFRQYYDSPLCGDIEGGVLPAKDVQEIIDDPFGIHAVTTGEKHINPNRFFSHYFFMKYLQNVPLWLQHFTNPISSVYLSCALFKIVIQLTFILLFAIFITGRKHFFNRNLIYITAILLPLVQVHGNYSQMAIIDKSIAYTFFYAFPLVLTMLFFLPFFNTNRRIRPAELLFVIPLTIILPFSGPLVPAVILIISALFFLNVLFGKSEEKKSLLQKIKNIPPSLLFLIPVCLLSLYSLYLGKYDSNYSSHTISLIERYKKLPQGIFIQIFHSTGFFILLLLIGINYVLLRRERQLTANNIRKALKWIGIFILIYVILLPMGGYRPYRPYIIRYDTFMPANIALFAWFGLSTWFLLLHLKKTPLLIYKALVIVCICFFTIADIKGINKNKCEREMLEKLSSSSDEITCLPDTCPIMSWGIVTDYRQTENKAKLFHYWRITDHDKLYYQKSKE